MPTIKFKFDHNQEHQLAAINSLIKLFDKLPQGHSEFKLGEEIIPNLPLGENFDEEILLANLNAIQEQNQIAEKNVRLDTDDGIVLEGTGKDESWRYPVFTVEMETGTGKTYVYLRTIYELKKLYGFRKFIIVVPSIAIYEGVLKAIEITREHFKTVYNNEHLNVIDYDSAEISKLRDFATSQFLQVMVITMAAFNKAKNNIYKRTEKLPGEKLPIEYIQEARPILILDETQRYTSEISKQALRTLHPLMALTFSATPGYKTEDGIKFDNLFYRLTPVQAFRMNLVKKIQVCGVTERFNFNRQFSMVLKRIKTDLTADMLLIANNRGQFEEKEFNFKNHDNLESKTKNEHYRGFKIEEINRREQRVMFDNGYSIALQGTQSLTPSKEEVFRIQIEETVKFHLERQSELLSKGIKVLSLFFIDKVANYVEEDGLVKRLFDAAFEKYKGENEFFAHKKAEEVREAYFAKKKTKEGEVAVDTKGKNEAERQAEKEAFELIMRDKERLLSLDEKVCFIFAHSALKEGWDNPNVFQICTLRETQSEMLKRQEIGRGMRLCVNQNGERVMDPDINVLTVVANESYEAFCKELQNEYAEAGEVAPQNPSDARKTPAKRNDVLYKSDDFKKFWDKLTKRTAYEIKIDTDEVINGVLARLSKENTPPPQILVKKGKYVITHVKVTLRSISAHKVSLEIEISDTLGNIEKKIEDLKLHDDLTKVLKKDILRGWQIIDIKLEVGEGQVVFANERVLEKGTPYEFDTEAGQRIDSRTVVEPTTQYPVFNLIERAHKETYLTRSTIFKIFQTLSEERKQQIFSNPEGFSNTFIFVIKEVLADHVAKNIRYAVSQEVEKYDGNEMFPEQKRYPQKEIIDGSSKSLYNLIQIDSDIEKKFVQDHLNADDKIILYFKFPMHFKIRVPKIIGNYVPDWGIVRLAEDGTYKLELVRETKATINENLLQFTNERRKIWCAERHFQQLGISYRKIAPEFHRWWEEENKEEELTFSRFIQQIEIVENVEGNREEYIPVLSLVAACGKFGETQDVEPQGWCKIADRQIEQGMFIAKAIGKSMESRIPEGAYCLFRAKPVGSRNGKILLVQHREIADPETGGSFTIKKYTSEKVYYPDGTWRHLRITLSPLNPEFKPIVLENANEDFESGFKVIAEFITALEVLEK